MKFFTFVLAILLLTTACATHDQRIEHWSEVLLNSPGNYSDQYKALDVLVCIGDQRAVPAIISYNEKEPNSRALKALTYLGGEKAKQYLKQRLKKMEQIPGIQQCGSVKSDVLDAEYAHTLAALSFLGEKVDLSYLYETLFSDDKGCAAYAANALGLVPGERTEKALIDFLYNSSERMQMPRSFAASSLVEIDVENVRLILMDLVEKDLLYLDGYTDCIDKYWKKRCGLKCINLNE